MFEAHFAETTEAGSDACRYLLHEPPKHPNVKVEWALCSSSRGTTLRRSRPDPMVQPENAEISEQVGERPQTALHFTSKSIYLHNAS